MDAEVKQRNRRRKRAQLMQQAQQQQQHTDVKNADSNEEDDSLVVRDKKPLRPLKRRKKSKEPLAEEDVVDGFAILSFKSYEDLEMVVKIANKENVRRLVDIERPKHEPIRPLITHLISAHTPHNLALTTHQDPATSDDSGRASERLTGSSVAPRDADSSRDRLSDASSRCSSGKGYICDSEGDDDKGSDASSVIFGSTPGSRKHEFPGALPPSLPSLNNGTGSSPVPAPTPPELPSPTPAPAQLPPPPPVQRHVIVEEKRASEMTLTARNVSSPVSASVAPPPASSVPLAVSASLSGAPPTVNAAAPVMHPPPTLVSTPRTESPAVATSAPAYHPPYQPLYTPYASTVHTPYSGSNSSGTVPTPTTTATTVTAAHQPAAACGPPTSRVHSPANRESFSNVSSLSRTSVNQQSCPPPTTTTVSSSLSSSKSWSAPQISSTPRPTPPPPLHAAPSYSSPMFAAPALPPAPAVSAASPTVVPPPPPSAPSNPNPFSAESLFQSSNQADMLRRELDNRFLASQDSRGLNVAPPPPPYLRTEMHQHQHHHTHVHQHTTSLLPPPPSSTLFPPPLQFKDIPKLGSHESPFYRQSIGIPPSYPGYSPSLLHPGLTGSTPFVPPSHMPAFQPKPSSTAEQSAKPKSTKSGKWNAMHVRVAWEIYQNQHKGDKGAAAAGALKGEMLRTPTHLFNPSVRTHELSSGFPTPPLSHRPPPPPAFDSPQGPSLFAAPTIGKPIGGYLDVFKDKKLGPAMSPFGRFAGPGFPPSPGASPFMSFPPSAAGRPNELSLLHDPWRRAYPPTLAPALGPSPWSIKQDPMIEQREREERERLRREREERERREREEKRRLEQKLQQQAEQRERERREKERREMEQREREQRERMLHQQRMAAESAAKAAAAAAAAAAPHQSVINDRSPLRNGDGADIRIKEEPRSKEDDLLRGAHPDPRYHPYLRPAPSHVLQSPMSRVLPPSMQHHYPPPPPTAHWPPPPTDPFYRYDPLRYNPLVDAAMRVEEERAKMFSYVHPAHASSLRTKDPGLMHLRPGPGPPPSHKMCPTPPNDLQHKKEEPR